MTEFRNYVKQQPEAKSPQEILVGILFWTIIASIFFLGYLQNCPKI